MFCRLLSNFFAWSSYQKVLCPSYPLSLIWTYGHGLSGGARRVCYPRLHSSDTCHVISISVFCRASHRILLAYLASFAYGCFSLLSLSLFYGPVSLPLFLIIRFPLYHLIIHSPYLCFIDVLSPPFLLLLLLLSLSLSLSLPLSPSHSLTHTALRV